MTIASTKTTPWLAALAISAGLGSFSMAQVTGKVTLDGDAPEMKTIDMSGVKECNAQHADPITEETILAGEKGELANVVISIKKEEGEELPGEASKTPAVLDQQGCMYVPHVVPMMVGQEMLVKNSDPFLHNVHSMAQTNASFNFGQPNKDAGKKAPEVPKAVETYKVKCDVHPWMLAWVRVLDNPFFATTGEDGTYKIDAKGLTDGTEYTFVAWHEKLGEQEQKATIKDGKAELNFTFKAEAAQAQPEQDRAKVLNVNFTQAANAKKCCSTDAATAATSPKAAESQAKAN